MRVSDAEVARIAAFLGMDEAEFIEHETELAPDRKSLMLKSRPDGSCAYLTADNLCRINPVKPDKCRTFPFEWKNPDSASVCPALGAAVTGIIRGLVWAVTWMAVAGATVAQSRVSNLLLFPSKVGLKTLTLETYRCIVAKSDVFWYTLAVNNCGDCDGWTAASRWPLRRVVSSACPRSCSRKGTGAGC